MLPYQDKKLTIRERVADILGRMTLQEKIGQVNQHLYGWQAYEKSSTGFRLTTSFKEHVKWGGGLGALYGLFRADPWSQRNYQNGIRGTQSAQLANQVQQYVITHSRLGIPTLIVEEMPHGHQALDAISYPTNLAKGNTFDPDLLEQSARLQADELRLRGGNLALVSSLDLLKDPRWGRAEETFSESPYLASVYTKAIVTGFQGDLVGDDFLSYPVNPQACKHVGVIIKHLIGQGEALGGHNSGTVPIGQREFTEVYEPMLDSIRHAVGVMAAYNDIDGVPCHANRWLLNGLLRKKVGFQGIVMADGTALDRLTDLYGSQAKAVHAALMAGVDLSLWDEVYLKIGSAIDQYPGLITQLDEAVSRVLATKFLLGLFDEKFESNATNSEQMTNLRQSRANNLKVATASMTLVKNQLGNRQPLLPLKPGIKIAAIGPQVENIYHWLGDYTGPQLKTQYTSFTTALMQYASKVEIAKGSQIRTVQHDSCLIEEAVTKAQRADAIILTLGGSSARDFDMDFLDNGALKSDEKIVANTDTGENVDVANLTLGGDQLRLLRALKTTGRPIVVVMIQGRPYDLTEVLTLADAVLLAWYPGQAGPQAVTDILFGKSQPTGRLPISYPRNSAQLPVYYYQRHVLKNEDYFDESGHPLLPFGYGLSYVAVTYENLTAQIHDDRVLITITLKNKTRYLGIETVIVFAKVGGTNVLPRNRQLISFQKVAIDPDSTVQIHFNISTQQFTYIDEDWHSSLPARVKLMVGHLSVTCQLI